MSSKRLVRGAIGSGLGLLAMILATPRKASAYVDPGTGALLWQAAAAACIGSLFYMRRIVMWARCHVDFHSRRAMGLVFASAYAVVASPLVCSLWRHGQLPRLDDIFLLGIMLTTYYFTWEGAVYLLTVGLLVSAWVFPPDGSSAVASHANLYRLVSFALVSLLLICLITRLKAGRVSSAIRHGSGIAVHRGAAGAD